MFLCNFQNYVTCFWSQITLRTYSHTISPTMEKILLVLVQDITKRNIFYDFVCDLQKMLLDLHSFYSRKRLKC